MANCTYIDGIASSQAIDTAGEVVDLLGLDCSSMHGAQLNWEHKSDLPAQIVGKVLEYKKIFGPEDCENDRHKYFWEKCQVPFLYCLGRLFDDRKDSSREVASLFQDDAEHPDEPQMVGFSIEGAKIDKQGMTITRSIARKLTITGTPANKTCIAQMVPNSGAEQPKDDLDSIFKTEPGEILLFKAEGKPNLEKPVASDVFKHAMALGIEPMNKALPGKLSPTSTPTTAINPAPKAAGSDAPKLSSPTNNPGTLMGKTKSGKSIMSHAKIHDYTGFSSLDHKEAAMMHHKAAQEPSEASEHHRGKMKLHVQAARTAENKETRFARGKAQNLAANHPMKKTLTAGSGMAAPGQLEGGAALAKESLSGKMKKPKKSEWFARAEEEYELWGKKEEFRAFMKERMPNMAMGEIDVVGKILALKKSLDAETDLNKLVGKHKCSSWKCSKNEHTDEELCKKDRCWAGYEATPGKKPYSKGSCRKK